METSPPPLEYNDRKTGLIIFGILTVLIGCLCALFVPLMLFGQAMAAKNGTPQNTQAIIPALVIYGLLAVALIWLGIGSMLARRWARALLLIFSWSWLVMGVIASSVMFVFLPRMMETMKSATPPGQPELPSAAQSGVMLFTMIIMGIIFVILPAAWVFFYQKKNVKATCEAYDPTVRWTDRCPLPVLAVSIWLALGVPMLVMTALTYRGVIPFFGMFVVGALGSLIDILLAAIWAYCAWSLYKLDLRGWWVIFVALALLSASSVVTYSRHDFSELYVLMGYPEAQITLMQKYNFFKGGTVPWLMVLSTAPMLGYLLYLRRFFPSRAKED